MSSTLTAPVQPGERADVLDALRGFALLGICLANVAVFSLYVFMPEKEMMALPTAKADMALSFFHFMFIDGKFYTIFSLLFGIGFTIILLNNEKQGNSLAIFYRRLIVMILLGLAHILLLWPGDILLLYALLGLLLPFFRNCSDRTLIITAICLVLSPLIFDLVKVLSHGSLNLANPLTDRAIAVDTHNGLTPENGRRWVMLHPNYRGIWEWNQGGFWWRWQGLLDTNRLPKVLGIFLIGLYVGRNQVYRHLEANREWLKKVCRWGIGTGLVTGVGFAYFELFGEHLPKPAGLWQTLFYALNVVPLGFGYAAGIALLWQKANWRKVLAFIAPAGRMALTNYIGQTLIGICLYYGIGFGLGQKVGPSVFLPIAILTWFIEVLWSRAWLSVFRYGPLEWIWRMLTYGKYLPIKK